MICDTRPDAFEYVLQTLPKYLPPDLYIDGEERESFVRTLMTTDIIIITSDLRAAVLAADVIQEQGPENLSFKISLWPEVERHCPPKALLWTSTSGILASTQSLDMKNPSRLVVVHPYNPPHIMPLLEVVPSGVTSTDVIHRTMHFWESRGRTPVLLKETTGFVANRLAFALFREAIHLVNEGVTSVEDVDKIVQSSMGLRWAVSGPFKSYHAGGGEGGLEAFFKNIGGTVQACWDSNGKVNAYGVVDTTNRDEKTRRVLEAAGSPV